MHTVADVPQALYRANMDLLLHLSKLLQDQQSRLLSLGARAYGDGLTNAFADIEAPEDEQQWDKPFRHQLHQRFDDLRDLGAQLIDSQSRLISDLADSLVSWQRDTASVLQVVDNTEWFDTVWDAFSTCADNPRLASPTWH